MEYFESINPADGRLIEKIPAHSDAEIDSAIDRADAAQKRWEQNTVTRRAALLKELSRVLTAQKEQLAARITLEMGKVSREALGEVEKCAWVCDYYAEEGPAMLADEPVKTEAAKAKVSFRPLGVVLIVMPWNFPFWQVFRVAAPAILAGNTVLLKHASNVMGCAREIERVFDEAAAPGGIFTSLFVSSARVETLLDHPAVRAVSLTGSEKAGAAVAALAAARIKKSVLELGGSDPYIVLADADLDLAAERITASRLYNGGQSCISAKRAIVHRDVYDEFLHRFVAKMNAAAYGPPGDPAHTYGPMARHDLRDQLYDQQQRSIAAGAQRLTGGFIPDSPGAYFPPTVLADVRPGCPAFDEELFGPVAAVVKAADEADAVRLANLSRYGLGAAIFTRDTQRAEHIATQLLQAGSVFVNSIVHSDPRLPFGGVKMSGYGRELSHHGLREFVNIKTISIAHT